MKTISLVLYGLTVLLGSVFAQDNALLPKGHICFQTDFETTNSTAQFDSPPTLADGFKGGKSLFIELKPGASPQSPIASIPLPVESMRGYTIRVSAMVKAESVSDKPKPWNGIKVMVPLQTPSQKLWPQAEIETGTFDWKKAAFAARIPVDATSAALCLGLEGVTGKVWFDDIVISVIKPPVSVKPRTTTGPAFKGHSLARLRGTMISANIDEDSLKVLGRDWNANLIRWQLTRHAQPGKEVTLEDYDQWLESELTKLDTLCPSVRSTESSSWSIFIRLPAEKRRWADTPAQTTGSSRARCARRSSLRYGRRWLSATRSQRPCGVMIW